MFAHGYDGVVRYHTPTQVIPPCPLTPHTAWPRFRGYLFVVWKKRCLAFMWLPSRRCH